MWLAWSKDARGSTATGARGGAGRGHGTGELWWTESAEGAVNCRGEEVVGVEEDNNFGELLGLRGQLGSVRR